MSSVAQILRKAESLGVRLRLNDENVRMNGPKDARDAIRADVIAHKSEIVARLRATMKDSESVPDDCEGALRDTDGGLYLPWGPKLSPDDLREMRDELVELIQALANAEAWEKSYLDEVLARAMLGPLSDLLPNLAHFRARVIEAAAQHQAREALRTRTWGADSDLTNRGGK